MNPRKGDTVRLAASVTLAEFGLALCDDDGAGLEIDGVVVEALPHMVNVRIKRLMHHSRITGPTEGCLLYTSPSPRDRSLSRMPSSA